MADVVRDRLGHQAVALASGTRAISCGTSKVPQCLPGAGGVWAACLARSQAQNFRRSRVHHALRRLTCIAVTPLQPALYQGGRTTRRVPGTRKRVPGSRGPIIPGVNRQVTVGLAALTRRTGAPARTPPATPQAAEE